MRCKSCDALMTKSEATSTLYTNEDESVVVYNDWCFRCNQDYGTEEALALLDTHWYQCGDITEDCEVYHTVYK